MPPAVSVVVSTYNRGNALTRTLRSLAEQRTAREYEVIVVDNNSTDDTRSVALEYVNRPDSRFRYVFESRQGLSYGRNAGIEGSTGPIIAFTDDDVIVSEDWIERIEAAFASSPDADYIGGKILPLWPHQPPGWLTSGHWAPLALADYGEQPLRSDRTRPICFLGANFAFKRAVFDRVGRFDLSTQRVKDGIGSIEDYEIQLRIWRAGMCGLYVPDLRVTAPVDPARMDKAYHRRWHRGHGKHLAAIRFYELSEFPWGPLGAPANLILLFGAPAFIYTQWIHALGRAFPLRHSESQRFGHECELIQLTAYISSSYRAFVASGSRSILEEIARFTRAYARKRMSGRPV